jgi:hypothetical protein
MMTFLSITVIGFLSYNWGLFAALFWSGRWHGDYGIREMTIEKDGKLEITNKTIDCFIVFFVTFYRNGCVVICNSASCTSNTSTMGMCGTPNGHVKHKNTLSLFLPFEFFVLAVVVDRVFVLVVMIFVS